MDKVKIAVKFCFDKLDYYETHNDLWDVHVRGDKFALIANLDSNCQAIIKTPVGRSNTLTLTNLIMQGSVFAGIKCSISMDTLGRDMLSSEDALGVYRYKGIIEVPCLSYIEDALGVSREGVESVELNAVMNSKIETKKLTLRADKCVTTKIAKKRRGKSSVESRPSLKIHNEDMKEVESFKFPGDWVNKVLKIQSKKDQAKL